MDAKKELLEELTYQAMRIALFDNNIHDMSIPEVKSGWLEFSDAFARVLKRYRVQPPLPRRKGGGRDD